MALSDLADDEFGELLRALTAADPAEGVPPEGFVRRVTEAVPRLGPREARRVVRALLSVQTARVIHGDPVAAFAKGIAASETLDLPPEAAATLAARIESLAQVDAVAITAKALDIAGEQDRVFHSSRILTDIRPVFGDDASQPPIGAVVTHVLRVDAYRNGHLEDYYVAMDTHDLLALRAIVNRAVDKNHSLNKVLDTFGFLRVQLSEEDKQ